MELRSRRLKLEELYLIRWVIGALMGLVSISTVFNIGGHNPFAAIVSLAGVSVCLLFRSLFVRIPTKAWTVFAVLILPLVSLDVLAKETIPALLNLNTWLVFYRSVNHTKRREEMQLVLLCLFLLVMTGILTASLIFALQLLVFSGLAISMLLLGSILESRGDGDIQEGRAFRDESLSQSLWAVIQRFNPRYLFLGCVLFSLLLGVAGLTFMVIPRIDVENKISLFRMKSTGSMSGFSEKIQLGEVTNIKNDNRIALRVDIPQDQRAPLTPYWRMLALDKYEDGALVMSEALKELMRSTLASPYHSYRYWLEKRFADTPAPDRKSPWTYYLEPNVSRFLPIAGDFERMTILEKDQLKIVPHIQVFGFSEPNSKMLSYQIEGLKMDGLVPDLSKGEYPIHLDNLRGKKSEEEGLVFPDTLLELPEDPRIVDYLKGEVRTILAGRELGPREFAEAAIRHLQRTHTYSMSVSLPEATEIEDPVIRWMQSDKPGHCEFFSSSLIMLSRAYGYAARAVVGYKGGAWNSYENYFMVRNSDAHAWCEIYDGLGSWFRVDPTPGSDIPTTNQAVVAATSRVGETDSMAFVDSLRILWYRRIVNFDERAQKEAAIQLRDFFLAYVEVAEEWASQAVKYLVRWATAEWTLGRILYLCFLASLLLGAIWLQRNMALNFRELILAPFRRGDPIRRKASKLLRKFESKGVLEMNLSEELGKIVSDLRRLRYGPKESWPSANRVFKGARRLL